jgi:hypothetical protein
MHDSDSVQVHLGSRQFHGRHRKTALFDEFEDGIGAVTRFGFDQ